MFSVGVCHLAQHGRDRVGDDRKNDLEESGFVLGGRKRRRIIFGENDGFIVYITKRQKTYLMRVEWQSTETVFLKLSSQETLSWEATNTKI